MSVIFHQYIIWGEILHKYLDKNCKYINNNLFDFHIRIKKSRYISVAKIKAANVSCIACLV
jgi:hypothetical protein